MVYKENEIRYSEIKLFEIFLIYYKDYLIKLIKTYIYNDFSKNR